MKHKKIPIIFAISLLMGLLLSTHESIYASSKTTSQSIKIGVLSHRGDKITLKMWSPLAIYLSKHLSASEFEIIPLKFDKIAPAVKNKTIDFLLVNPGIYVNLEVKYRVSRIVTLKKLDKEDQSINVFAGVAFTLADNQQINSYKDLSNKTFIAVDKTSLGGFQMVWRELFQLGIDPWQDFLSLDFAGTHDAVVMEVKQGSYDAGTVRTGILEKMAKEGRIKLDEFKIISPKTDSSFPFLHSTRLYPEWPFSKLTHTSNILAQKVAIALMNMPDNNFDHSDVDYTGWTVPLDYQEVHGLFKELAIDPYSQPIFTLYDAIKKYWLWLLFISIFLFLMGLMILWIIYLNRRLMLAKQYLEQQHDLILNSVCDGIYGVDLEGKCTFINQSMENITGWSARDMIGKQQHLFLHHTHEDGTPHPASQCPVYLTMNDLSPRFIKDDIFWKKDGSSFPVEYSSTPLKDTQGKVLGSVVVFRDISERRQLEENTRRYQSDLAHMGRLNTMGEMASGMAHELNQPLTAITSSAYAAIQLLESGHVSTDKVVDILEKINKHALRSGDIIRHLRKLVRREQPSYSEININQLIDGVLTLMQPEIKKSKVKLVRTYEQKLPLIVCQSIQIDQVVLNLCKNAIESMQQSSHRLLQVTTEMAGKHAIIVSIMDTGQGVDKQIEKGLFDPFISNKKEGMGLGLSISKAIIEAHHGNLYYATKDDRIIDGHSQQLDDPEHGKEQEIKVGSIFRFVLPLFIAEEDRSAEN